jgi:hypothetical protein
MRITAQTTRLAGVKEHSIAVTTERVSDTPSEKVLVILPGYRYPSQAPACFYSRMVFLERGWDVVSFDYRYNEIPGFLAGDGSEAERHIQQEVSIISDYMSRELAARSVCILAKSLGTTLLSHMVNGTDVAAGFRQLSTILLTPTDRQGQLLTWAADSKVQTMVAIGDADAHYDESIHSAYEGIGVIRWTIVPCAGHVFESDDGAVQQSMANVTMVVEDIRSNLDEGWFG